MPIFFAPFALFAVNESQSSVRGRDKSRLYFVILVLFVVISFLFFGCGAAALSLQFAEP